MESLLMSGLLFLLLLNYNNYQCHISKNLIIMRKYLLLSFVFALISLLSSCQKEESVAEYIPFRSEKDGKWGFINLDGDVLLEDK